MVQMRNSVAEAGVERTRRLAAERASKQAHADMETARGDLSIAEHRAGEASRTVGELRRMVGRLQDERTETSVRSQALNLGPPTPS